VHEIVAVVLKSGTSSDWVKANGSVIYSYYINLRPLTPADGGYIIGPENIAPTGLEIFNGFTAICRQALTYPAATSLQRQMKVVRDLVLAQSNECCCNWL
jgi:hypothetical protein